MLHSVHCPMQPGEARINEVFGLRPLYSLYTVPLWYVQCAVYTVSKTVKILPESMWRYTISHSDSYCTVKFVSARHSALKLFQNCFILGWSIRLWSRSLYPPKSQVCANLLSDKKNLVNKPFYCNFSAVDCTTVQYSAMQWTEVNCSAM